MTDAPVRRRRPALPDVLCAAGLLVNTVLGAVLSAAQPALLAHHAVLLEALTSSPLAMVTGGALARVGRAALPLVLVAPLCGVLAYDVFLWWAGRRWGGPLLRGYERRPGTARWVARADGWVRDHGVRVLAVAYFLPVPNPLLYAACGAAGMPLALFVVGDAVGTLLWTGLLVGLGWGLGQRAVAVVDGVGHYGVGAAVAVVVVLVGVRAVRRRRRA